MGYLRCQKNIEGSIFQGQDRTSKLFRDLNLGGPDDLRSGLRGHLRLSDAKIKKNTTFLIIRQNCKKHLNLRLSEAIEAVKAVEVVEAFEIAEAIEVVEAVILFYLPCLILSHHVSSCLILSHLVSSLEKCQ